MSETPKIDMAGGSLPNTRIRQTESLASDSSDCSLPASPDIPGLLRRLEMLGSSRVPMHHSVAQDIIRKAHATLAQLQEALEQAQSDFDSFAEHHRATEAKLREAEARVKEWIVANAPGGWIDDLRTRRSATNEALAREVQRMMADSPYKNDDVQAGYMEACRSMLEFLESGVPKKLHSDTGGRRWTEVLCTKCGGNGVLKISGGVETCSHCEGRCYEPAESAGGAGGERP